MKLLLKFFAVSFLLYGVSIHAQNNVRESWVKNYAEPDSSNEATAMLVDSSGNVYVIGKHKISFSWPSFNVDFITIKYNTFGDEQWVARYDGPGNGHDETADAIIDQEGNVYVAGTSASSGTYPYNYDFVTVKYRPNGVEEWIARSGGSNDEWASALELDRNGNIIVVGSSTGPDALFVKYSHDGQELSQILFDDRCGPNDIVVDDLGNIYIMSSYRVGKLDREGVLQWCKTFRAPSGITRSAAMAVDNHHDLYVTGWVEYAHWSSDFVTAKYDSNGTQKWMDIYPGSLGYSTTNYYARAITIGDSGNIYIAGTGENHYTTIKYEPTGRKHWIANYNEPPGIPAHGPTAITLDDNGDIYVTGGADDDILTIKYNSFGEELWKVRFSSPLDDRPIAIIVDKRRNVYVAGNSVRYTTRNESIIRTIKYTQTPVTSIKNVTLAVPNDLWLAQNYPNPFNPTTNISYNLPQAGNVHLAIYDISGRQVELLVHSVQSAGRHSIKWNAENQPSGVYLYRLMTNNFIATKKLLLIK